MRTILLSSPPLPTTPIDPDASSIAIIDDKSKAQLYRVLGDPFHLTFNQIGHDIPTFADAA